LLVITVPTVWVIFVTAAPAPRDALHVRVVGHQWWWEYQYTDANTRFTTANELHVPTGRVVSFQLVTADVMHSFWIPKMGGKRDLIPNHVNALWFTAPDHPGVFPGQCGEFCGISHASMSTKLFVDTPTAFDRWVKTQRAAATAPATALEKRGQLVFLQSGCVACHTLMGTFAQGTLGPNLSHVGSRSTIGAVLLANTPANMALWIHDPPALKPGALMPPQPLNAADLKAVVAYLQSRK
jgi:cytochrome c oxidase subunit 2